MPLITDPDVGTLSERWTLDGLGFHLAPWRILSLTRTLPAQRPTWLESPDADGAILLEDPKVTNAELVFRLMLDEQDSKDDALEKIRTLEAKLTECSKTPAGLPLVWEPYGASTRTATVACLTAEITDVPIGLDGDGWWWFQDRPVITVRLVTEPFGELDEVTGPIGSTSTGEPISITFNDVLGTAPALGDLVVTDDDTVAARYLAWGAGLDTTSPLTIAAGTVGGGTLVTAGFGAHAGTVSSELVATTTVFASNQAVCGTGELPHQGTYRVIGRVQCADTSTECRLAWQANDGEWTFNDWASPPVLDAFAKVDLGRLTLTDSGVGTQTWQGRIEAFGSGAFSIERLQLIPTDVGQAVARAPASALAGAFVGFDDFTSTSSGGTLNGRTPAVGSAWATAGGTADFTFVDAAAAVTNPGEAIQRTQNTSRIGVLGSALTGMRVAATMGATGSGGGGMASCGVVARWADANNYIALQTINSASSGGLFTYGTVQLRMFVAGVGSTLRSVGPITQTTTSMTLEMTVTEDGDVTGRIISPSGVEISTLEATSSSLATGGALASGKGGIVDGNITATSTRWYDDISVTELPSTPAIIYPDRDLRLTHESMLRADDAGVRYGRVVPVGSYLTIPQAGDPDRSTRLVVFAHRNDLDVGAWDTVGLDLSVTSSYTPRVKVVP